MDSSPSLDIVFAGTPDFAARHLQALQQSHHRLVGVYTQPDRPAGRGKKLTASPVKHVAQAANLPVFQPESLRGADAQEELRGLQADVIVVVAYGLLLPQAALDIPRLGCINVHASLLPRWRGAAPIQRAIEAGDAQTGVTIMQMEAGLDTGPMLRKAVCDIDAQDTAASLHDRLAELGPPALLETLADLANGTARPEIQDDSQSNYARKIDKAEAELDWRLSADELARKVRAFNPFPTAFTFNGDDRIRIQTAEPVTRSAASEAPGAILKVESSGILISCGQDVLRIMRLQLPGKKPMDTTEFVNGFPGYFSAGQLLGRTR